MILKKLKFIIKSSIFLTIIFDYLISKTGVNFENEYRIIKIINKKKPLIIDIGAHTGESIKNFLKFNKKSRIIAFEPISKNFEIIKKYSKNNKNIRAINKAVTNSNSKLFIFVPYLCGYSLDSLSSIAIEDLKKRINHFFNIPLKKFKIKKILIKTTKIDNFNFKPDLIKIDTEGSEYNVLISAKNTISKNNPIIIIEYNHNNYFKIEKFLNKLRYKPFVFNNNKIISLQKREKLKIKKDTNLINIIFLTKKYFYNIDNYNL